MGAKTITSSGHYVLNKKIYIDLQAAQECIYPDAYPDEKFATKLKAKQKYPKLDYGDDDSQGEDEP